MTITFASCIVVLPWPDASLLPNRSNGRHWRVRQDAKEAARLIAVCEAQSQHLQITGVTADHAVTIVLEPPDKRKRDVDGVLSALKPSLDGIAKALDIDDVHFNPITITRSAPVKGGRVTVRIDDAIPF